MVHEKWGETVDVARGIEHFNKGDFFGAHEAWEEEWRRTEESPERHFLQGMIMIAAALHHFRRKEYAGTHKLLRRGLEVMESHRKADVGIEMGDFIESVRSFHERFRSEKAGLSERDFPRIRVSKEKPGEA